jgi:ABC transporter DrrB family efflux protein
MTTTLHHDPTMTGIPAIARSKPPGTVASSLVVARRSLVKFIRTPQLVVVATIQGALFLLIFRYVFGGAIGTSDGLDYVDFLVPGFVVTGVLFSGMAAAAGVAEDLQHGFVDRLRSLPIPRSSIATGRALAETVLVAWGVLITVAIGVAVGFRPAGSVADSLVAVGLVTLFGFAFTWLFLVIGLVAGSAQAAQGMSMLVFPLTFVSSAYVPVSSMPGWMQPIARNQPVSAMVDAARAWFSDDAAATLGHSTASLTVEAVLWSAGLVVVFAPLATVLYRRAR